MIRFKLNGDYNVATLNDIRLSLMKVRLDLNRLDRALDNKHESEAELLRQIQEVINDNCNKLSILEGELTNAGIQ